MRRWTLLLLFFEGAASGGPLGQVVEGMREAKSNDDDRHDSSPQESSSQSQSSDDSVASTSSAPVDVHLTARVGVASIVGSGPAVNVGVALRIGYFFALTGQLDSFFEDELRLDLWRGGAALCLIGSDTAELWLDLAVAGVHTEPGSDVALVGISGGGRIEQRVSPLFAVSAYAGTIALQHDIRALELAISLRTGFVSVGYRLVDFNVGPPLHGPEVGLAFSI